MATSTIIRGYHVDVFFSEEDGGYIADIPDLEFCSAFGRSREEARRELELAKDAWVASALEDGVSIPPPQTRPAPDEVSPASITIAADFPGASARRTGRRHDARSKARR